MSVSDESVTPWRNIRFLIENCWDVSFYCVLLLISGYISSFSCYFSYLWLQFILNSVYFNRLYLNIIIYFYYTFFCMEFPLPSLFIFYYFG